MWKRLAEKVTKGLRMDQPKFAAPTLHSLPRLNIVARATTRDADIRRQPIPQLELASSLVPALRFAGKAPHGTVHREAYAVLCFNRSEVTGH